MSSALRSVQRKSETTPFPARGKTDIPFDGWLKGKVALGKKIVDILNPNVNQKPNSFTLRKLHDLRRAYAANLQRLDVKLEIIEALLDHVSGTRAGMVGVYQRRRHEVEMREAVTTYEAWFTKVIASE